MPLETVDIKLKAESHMHQEHLKKCDNDISRKFEQVRHSMKEYLIREKYGNEKSRELGM